MRAYYVVEPKNVEFSVNIIATEINIVSSLYNLEIIVFLLSLKN
jgi:hypothetical protein